MTSFFPVTICLNHANEKKDIWSTIVVWPVMQDMWHRMCLSHQVLRDVNVADGFIFYTVGAFRHTINHSSVATLHL